ncbi:MAG: hypothetical protein A2Y79_07200 [Deltaproteobacteria bacterium RBG_13_43_22]|nr:MAG: hypothetical protein A2Y79_07200 [Deltaproteobacteria bacterium RBG_13_43_22]
MAKLNETINQGKNSLSDILLGDPGNYSLENRIFNAVFLIGAITEIIGILRSTLLGVPGIQTVAFVILFVIALTAYWLSRVLKISLLINKFVIITFLCLLSLFWLYSGGLMGSAPYIFFILLVATVVVIPKGSKLFFVLLELLVICILLIIERFAPSSIVYYDSPNQQFYDLVISLFLSTILVVTTVHIVFMQYAWEKESKEKLLAQVIQDKEAIEKAYLEIKQLRGIIPICADCKKIRNDKGYWEQVEQYISDHSQAEFTHSICPNCAKKMLDQET